MKNIDSLPIPKWLVKNKKLKLPNGNIVTFGGITDNKIIVTKEELVTPVGLYFGIYSEIDE